MMSRVNSPRGGDGFLSLSKSDKDVLEAMFLIEGMEDFEGTGLVCGEEFHRRLNITKRITSLIEEIISSEHEVFEVIKTDDQCKVIKKKFFGNRFIYAIREENVSAIESPLNYKANPYLDLFISCVSDEGLRGAEFHVKTAFGDGVDIAVEKLNKCIAKIRVGAKSKVFKSKLKSWRRSVSENFKSLTSYIDGLFDVCSRMLVIRLDVFYLEEFRRAGGISIKDALLHRDKLIKDLKKGLFGKVLGYAWKFEIGIKKGPHFHILLFFDGSKVRKDVVLAEMIGEHWRKLVTFGVGHYYNCNGSKNKYRKCGIGMIAHNDKIAREGLREAAGYMTKLDEFFKLSIAGVRSFGKGGLPKRKSSRGRSRLH